MIRNFKTLGLALIAVLAMNAMAASAAQAQSPGKLTIEGGGTGTLTGTEIGPHTLILAGRVITCNVATFHGSGTSGNTSGTVTPTYGDCNFILAPNTFPATVTMNGCDYVFDDFTTVPAGDYVGTADLVCPPTKDVELHVYENHTKHTAGTNLCRYTIQPQTGLGPITASNDPGTVGPPAVPNDITVEAAGVNVAYTRVAGTTGNCGGTPGTGVYNGNTTVQVDVGGVLKGLTVSD